MTLLPDSELLKVLHKQRLPDLVNFTGYAANSQTDIARFAWLDDVLRNFNLCSSLGPVVAVGETPGLNGAQLNFVHGSFPNPALGGRATIRFELSRSAEVTLRLYNVAGRLMHTQAVKGQPGENRFPLNGHKLSPGVYFYRLSSPGVDFHDNQQRLVIVGR